MNPALIERLEGTDELRRLLSALIVAGEMALAGFRRMLRLATTDLFPAGSAELEIRTAIEEAAGYGVVTEAAIAQRLRSDLHVLLYTITIDYRTDPSQFDALLADAQAVAGRRRLADAARRWTAAAERGEDLEDTEAEIEEAARSARVAGGGWPEPEELPPLHPSAPDLPLELLAALGGLTGWLEDEAERMQTPLCFPAAAAVVALSAAAGRRALIHPFGAGSWTVTPNLWGLVIGPPGAKKSPAIAEAVRPLRDIERDAALAWEQEAPAFAARLRMALAQERAITKRAENLHSGRARKETATPEELREQLREAVTEREDLERVLRTGGLRLSTSDATTEKLADLLRDHQMGLLCLRDELVGLLEAVDRSDRRGDREFFLTAWNGDSAWQVDRIGRGSIHVPSLCLSIFGSTQPGKWARYVSEATAGGKGADGLLQRFQVTVWPEIPPAWNLVDREPNRRAQNAARSCFRRVVGMDPRTEEPLRFTAEAQPMFNEWITRLEGRLREPVTQKTPAFEAHLSKYRSLVPSLALLFELATDPYAKAVSLRSAAFAAAWADFLEVHARKVYAAELGGGREPAHRLAEKLQAGAVEDGMPIRDLYRAGWGGLSTSDAVEAAVAELERRGWVRVQEIPPSGSGGRPSRVLRLNPLLARSNR